LKLSILGKSCWNCSIQVVRAVQCLLWHEKASDLMLHCATTWLKIMSKNIVLNLTKSFC